MEGLSYGAWLMVAITVAYSGTAIDLAISGKWAFAVVFGSYAVANAGLLWMMK